MVKRKIRSIAFLLCLCLCFAHGYVLAVSTSDASAPISPDKECSLTISYHCEEILFPNLLIKLYKIAELSEDHQFTLTYAFSDSGVILNGIKSASEWNVVRSTLEAYIVANGIAADFTTETDQNGLAKFNELKTGLYLAMTVQSSQTDYIYSFDSALISLPNLGSDSNWEYNTYVTAKPQVMPSDRETQLKVIKLWKGDEGQNQRPESVEVEIFRNGISYEKITLSEDNHWSYTWTSKEEGSVWNVMERNVPSGYTVTVEEKEHVFVLTNTYEQEGTDVPDPPQTGDTTNILLYIIIMILSGAALVALGTTGKRNRL